MSATIVPFPAERPKRVDPRTASDLLTLLLARGDALSLALVKATLRAAVDGVCEVVEFVPPDKEQNPFS